ncbi:uncharacterized protein [Rutidosis leptorrhynchoides]|uniref:uncharacterized protein n=1 Tax=Rutidosis leptorrhynchoides TaxID=125765 RepID=UPI003A9A2A42
MAERDTRGVDSYYQPGDYEDHSPIVYPAPNADNNRRFEVNRFTDEEVRLRLFPYSLKDKAKRELFHEAYERLKELLRSCNHQKIPKWELVKVFYDGLDSQNRQFLLEASGGVFMTRSSEDECAFFEQLSKGSKTQASVERKTHNPSHVNHVSNSGCSTRNLEKELDEIKMLLPMFNNPNQGGSVNFVQVQDMCSNCGDPSQYANGCKKGITLGMKEQVNEIQGRKYDPFSNTYNQGWRNHPNFSSDNNQYQRQNQNLSQNNQQSQSSSTDARMESLMEEMKKTLEIQNKSIAALGKQIGQVAEEKATRESDTIPSYTLLNPNHESQVRGHEVNMVGTLRNGKADDNKLKMPRKSEIKYGPGKSPTLHDLSNNVNEVQICVFKNENSMHHCPKKVKLTEKVSAVISSSLSPKFKDPGTPLISVTVGNVNVKKALLDFGACINILSSSFVDRYELGTLKRTDILIQLADRSMRTPMGMLKNVIVKVEDFYYPVDFIVMDIETNFRETQPTIILSRPFLATIDDLINCRTGVMDISFGNKRSRINIFNSLHTPDVQDCFLLDTNHEQVESSAHTFVECPMSKDVWSRVARWWNKDLNHVVSFDDRFLGLLGSADSIQISKIWQAIKWVTGYILWKNRNNTIFRKKKSTGPMILNEIQLKSFEWISNRSRRTPIVWSQWLINPSIYDDHG